MSNWFIDGVRSGVIEIAHATSPMVLAGVAAGFLRSLPVAVAQDEDIYLPEEMGNGSNSTGPDFNTGAALVFSTSGAAVVVVVGFLGYFGYKTYKFGKELYNQHKENTRHLLTVNGQFSSTGSETDIGDNTERTPIVDKGREDLEITVGVGVINPYTVTEYGVVSKPAVRSEVIK